MPRGSCTKTQLRITANPTESRRPEAWPVCPALRGRDPQLSLEATVGWIDCAMRHPSSPLSALVVGWLGWFELREPPPLLGPHNTRLCPLRQQRLASFPNPSLTLPVTVSVPVSVGFPSVSPGPSVVHHTKKCGTCLSLFWQKATNCARGGLLLCRPKATERRVVT